MGKCESNKVKEMLNLNLVNLVKLSGKCESNMIECKNCPFKEKC